MSAPRYNSHKKGTDEPDYGISRYTIDKPQQKLIDYTNVHSDSGRDGRISKESGNKNSQNLGSFIEHDENNSFIETTVEEATATYFKKWPPEYGRVDIIITVASVALFLTDVGLDIKLMWKYYTTDRVNLFWLTLGSMIVPAFLSGVVSIVWVFIDRKGHIHYSKITVISRVIWTFIRLGRVFRNLEFIYYVLKARKTDSKVKKGEIFEKANAQNRDAAILGLMDGFFESVTQLMLQLCLAIILSLEMDVLRVLTLLSSWLSTSVTMTAFYSTARRADKATNDVALKALPIYTLWRFCELGPRFILLALGIAFLRPWFYIGVGIHFVLALVMHRIINPELKGVCVPNMKLPFLFLISFISIFCFINLKPGQTWKRAVIFYIIYYAENFVVMGIILSMSSNYCIATYRWYCASYILLPGGILHLLFQCLYYGACHPSLEPTTCSKRCCLK